MRATWKSAIVCQNKKRPVSKNLPEKLIASLSIGGGGGCLIGRDGMLGGVGMCVW